MGYESRVNVSHLVLTGALEFFDEYTSYIMKEMYDILPLLIQVLLIARSTHEQECN